MNDTSRKETAEVLLETLPAVMGYVSSDLRRNSPVDNNVHFRILRTLRRGNRSLHELAEMHAVRLPTMSRTISVLEQRRWVERIRCTADRRTVFAQLTEQGLETLREVERMAIDRAAELLNCLEDTDLESLRKGLATLYRVMQQQMGPLFEQGEYAPDASMCAGDPATSDTATENARAKQS
ncbi:MAG: MarR family winged helix-turn-helix transcriptional regulator [Spirochaetales bacterium]